MTSPRGERVRCVDWLRGGAVVLMVGAHSLAFLSPAHDRDAARDSLNAINGLPAPAFLLAAGFALALVTARQGDDPMGRSRRAWRSLSRVGVVLLASLLLRHILWDTFRHLERFAWIDVLTGIALMLLGLWLVLFAMPPRDWLRYAALATLAAVAFLAGPWVAAPRSFGWATPLLNNSWESNTWPIVPWAGYGWAGAILGLATGRSATPRATLARGLIATVAIGMALGWGAAILRPLFGVDPWMVANAGERLYKVALITLGLLMIERRRGATSSPGRIESFFNLLSRQALWAYVIHQILLFGWGWFRPFNRFLYREDWPATLGLGAAILALTTLACVAIERLTPPRKRPVSGRPKLETAPAARPLSEVSR